MHLTNAISTGGTAIGQAVAVSFAGYFFYLTRRVSGGLIVPALIHGLFDFSILSGAADDKPYAGGLAAIVVYPLVAVILLARRHRIEPGSATPPPARRAVAQRRITRTLRAPP